jgi:hypothetical protein
VRKKEEEDDDVLWCEMGRTAFITDVKEENTAYFKSTQAVPARPSGKNRLKMHSFGEAKNGNLDCLILSQTKEVVHLG